MADPMTMIAQGGSFLKDIASFASIFSGGLKSQTSNRDYQHQQNLLDSGNPREIKRQAAFLEGLAPSQASAYNTIQDATYAEDTQRQTDRIQTMGSELGMSPWEITGSPGSAPLPSPTGPAPQNNNAQYLSSLAQMQSSVNQNKTALKIAAMNNDTALKTTAMQTGTAVSTNAATNETAKIVANIQTANGSVPVTQAALNTANAYLAQANESKANTETSIMYNTDRLNTIRTLGELASKTTINVGPYSRTANNSFPDLVTLYNKLSDGMATKEQAEYLATVPGNIMEGVEKDLTNLSRVIVKSGSNFVSDVGNFLTGMTQKRK